MLRHAELPAQFVDDTDARLWLDSLVTAAQAARVHSDNIARRGTAAEQVTAYAQLCLNVGSVLGSAMALLRARRISANHFDSARMLVLSLVHPDSGVVGG